MIEAPLIDICVEFRLSLTRVWSEPLGLGYTGFSVKLDV